MATNIRKRRGDASLELSTKRLRIDPSSSLPVADLLDDDDDNDNEYHPEQDEVSEDDTMEAADTPNTPFSPVPGKKFPSEYKTIKCTYEGCTKSFNRPARLQAHLRSHANERPFICTYEGCDKAYIEEKHLKQHIKGSHTHERDYTCDWEGCNKSFLTATRLTRHRKAHEGHERFRCTSYPPCNQAFRKHQTLHRHIRSDHLNLSPFPCTYIDPITNELCKAGFDASGGLKKHMERTHGAATFLCEECTVPGKFHEDGTPVPLAFTTNAKLQTHIKKEHANCMFCDRKCSSQALLQKHIDTQHSGTTLEERKNIACEYPGCPKTFTKRANLQVHVRTVHEGQRFICGTFDVSQNPDLAAWNGNDGCGKDFVSKVNLEDHIRTSHLGLPSLLNARGRRKAIDSQPRRSVRRAPEQTEIEELAGYDSRRTINCVVQGCPHKFMRDYDFHEHMRIHHQDMSFMNGQDDINLNVDMGMIGDFTYTNTGGELPSLDFMNDGTNMDLNSLGMGMDMIDPALHTPNFNIDAHALGSAAAAVAPQMNEWNHADVGANAGAEVAEDMDLDWELQRQALEGGQFWIGGEEPQLPEGAEEWSRDRAEMKKLIEGTGL